MNQEIKDKLEQAAENFVKRIDPKIKPVTRMNSKSDFVKGAQTILDNPSEWGLFTPDQMRGQCKHNHVETWYESHIQKEKYREALERLLEENMCSHAGDELIEEALKTGGKQ